MQERVVHYVLIKSCVYVCLCVLHRRVHLLFLTKLRTLNIFEKCAF